VTASRRSVLVAGGRALRTCRLAGKLHSPACSTRCHLARASSHTPVPALIPACATGASSHRPEEQLPMGNAPREGPGVRKNRSRLAHSGSEANRPSEALRAGDTSACPGSWRTFSRCHLYGIQMPMCRAFDLRSA
jgi:hypothetical protein